MTGLFQGKRLYYRIEGAGDTDHDRLISALSATEESLAGLPAGAIVTISDDPCNVKVAPAGARSAPVAPEYLEQIQLTAMDIVLSAARERLVKELTSEVQRYWKSSEKSALVLLLDGPPGTGKTTLAREVARRVGRETFRPQVSIESRYVSDTANRIANIFDLLRRKQALLIWDDLDRLFTERLAAVDTGARDHRNTLATVFAGLDETRVVIIGTTNTKDSLDKAFVSRIKFRKSVPDLEADERKARLRSESSRRIALSDDEIQEVIDAGPWMSFRDIETFCRSVPTQAMLPLPRFVEAWRNSFADRTTFAPWSGYQPAEMQADSRIWDLEVVDTGSTVWAASRGRQVLGGALLPHGQLAQMNQITAGDDIRFARYDRRRDLLLLGTDRGLCVVDAARSKRKLGPRTVELSTVRTTHGYVWDAQWLDDDLAIAAYKDGTISLCRYARQNVIAEQSALKVKGCRSLCRVGKTSDADYLLVGSETSPFSIIRVDRRAAALSEVGQLACATKESMSHRRIVAIPRSFSRSLVAIPGEQYVSVYEWTPTEASLLTNIVVKDCTGCAFDASSTRFAISAGAEIHIYSSVIRTNVEPPRVVKSPTPVTSLAFGRLGQTVVWGTEDGKLFSATAICDRVTD